MRNLRLGASLISFSIFALLLLRYVPALWSDDRHFANSTFSYLVLGLVFYVAVYFLGLPSLEYFRLPRFHYLTLVAVLVAATFVSLEFKGSEELHVKGWVAVGGVAFLLAIGFGEEMVSRAFTFGILHKFGNLIAISISSIFFGLMHLNLYLGADWDPWEAYWHVVSAAAFGVFAAPPESTSGRQDWGVSFWEGFTLPLGSAGLYISSALVLLMLNRGSVPMWVYRLAIKWKLVHVERALESVK